MEKNKTLIISKDFLAEIRTIVAQARQQTYAAINQTMVQTYWQIGKRIVEEEQNGRERADYGKQLLKQLSLSLTEEFGKGFSVQNLYSFRQFYQTFPEIFSTPWRILTWSHYKRIMHLTNEQARQWYLKESSEQMWSYATLNRNISTQYYERLLMSQSKAAVATEMKIKTQAFDQDKLEFIKNPLVTEFLGLPSDGSYTESNLEGALISHLEKFLLELGKGYTLAHRQKLIKTEKQNYYIDLVFYNYILRCFVLVDLKVNKITHQDVGQMDMYRRMYDEMMVPEGHNPTIGIILCAETDEDIARYSILHENDHLYQAKYMTYLPTEEELKREIEQQKAIFALQQTNNKDNKV